MRGGCDQDIPADDATSGLVVNQQANARVFGANEILGPIGAAIRENQNLVRLRVEPEQFGKCSFEIRPAIMSRNANTGLHTFKAWSAR